MLLDRSGGVGSALVEAHRTGAIDRAKGLKKAEERMHTNGNDAVLAQGQVVINLLQDVLHLTLGALLEEKLGLFLRQLFHHQSGRFFWHQSF